EDSETIRFECALGQGSLVVGRLSEHCGCGGQPRGIERDGAGGVAEDVPQQWYLTLTLSVNCLTPSRITTSLKAGRNRLCCKEASISSPPLRCVKRRHTNGTPRRTKAPTPSFPHRVIPSFSC